MGDRAEAGSLSYSVLESVYAMKLGDGATARVPQHGFLLLRLSITNGGSAAASSPAATLISPSGQEYAELSDGTGVENWLGVLRRLNATETIFGWIAFDVPRGDYQLRVSDDAFDPADARQALIQIPLKLVSTTDATLPAPKPNR